MKTYLRKIMAFINDEEGASAIEYALLVALIALAITVGATTLGGQDQHDVHNRRRQIGCALTGSGADAAGLRPRPFLGNQSCQGGYVAGENDGLWSPRLSIS